MNPAELFGLTARLTQYAENLAVEGNLVNAARKRVGRIQHLIWSGCNADCPWRSALSYTLLCTGLVPKPRLCIRRHRYVDFDFAQELPVGVEDLNATIPAIGDIDVSLGVGGDTVRRVEHS